MDSTHSQSRGCYLRVRSTQKGFTVDGLIVNFQEALNNPAVQKIIAVSDPKRLSEIENEVKSLPESLRKSLSYWEV